MQFRYFLCDKSKVSKKVKISSIKYILSITVFVSTVIKYKKMDFSQCNELLKSLRCNKEKEISKTENLYDLDELLAAAIDLEMVYRFFGYIFRQSDLCLSRSFALAYTYIFLGIPCTLVIGRAEYYLNRKYDFHAWVEIGGIPVNDNIGVMSQWRKVYSI